MDKSLKYELVHVMDTFMMNAWLYPITGPDSQSGEYEETYAFTVYGPRTNTEQTVQVVMGYSPGK